MSSFSKKRLRRDLKESAKIYEQLQKEQMEYLAVELRKIKTTMDEVVETIESSIEGSVTEEIIKEVVGLVSVKNEVRDEFIGAIVNKLLINYNLVDAEKV